MENGKWALKKWREKGGGGRNEGEGGKEREETCQKSGSQKGGGVPKPGLKK